MVQTYPNLKMSDRNTWNIITVTRNNHELGSLHAIRQCFEFWELEMEKWGCNGLGETLEDGKSEYLHLFPDLLRSSR